MGAGAVHPIDPRLHSPEGNARSETMHEGTTANRAELSLAEAARDRIAVE